MLNKLNENEIFRSYGNIPQDILDEIRFTYNEMENPELAGQIAIAAIEYTLCGNTSFDDKIEIKHALHRTKKQMECNLQNDRVKYNNKIIDQKLEEIAKLYYYDNYTQQMIADYLHVSQKTISNRLDNIKQFYPELYTKYNNLHSENNNNYQRPKFYIIYRFTFPDNKYYIGITSQSNPDVRWQNGNGYKHQSKIYNAICQFGWDNIKRDILYNNLDKETAQQLEHQLIQEYNSINNGYNTKP